MEQFAKLLEQWFERAHARVLVWSEHWRAHTNRRTIIAALVVGILATFAYLYVIRPPDNFPAGQLVSVAQGESVSQIASDLYQDGVIRSPLAFRIIVVLLRQQSQLRAGDYLFKEPESIFSIERAIALGAYGLEPFKIRIPEGETVREMADVYDKILPRFDPQEFLQKALPQEGYLFPDTYFFLPDATADTVISAMRQNFDTQEATITPEVIASGHSLNDIVIMASIIEREASDMKDRQMIAGVLWRRLRMGMALQSDVTSLYTLPKGQSLTAADLKIDTPYNTYLNPGLPPTPIGSPSLSALEAAATPIDKGYLFYLADKNGVTHYCKTYSCQLANERKYLGE